MEKTSDSLNQTALKMETKRTRRIGSISAGLVLIVYGVLFLIHLFVPALDYRIIFNIWPVIFIFLGVEILAGLRKEGTEFKYDGGAIFLILVMACFAMGMAGMDWLMDYAEKYHYIHL